MTYYINLLLETHRGNYRGFSSNAKPFFLLSLFELIGRGNILGNMFKLPFPELEAMYKHIYNKYEPDKNITPIYKPYFHLNSESYYIIKWKAGTDIPTQSIIPSFSFLQNNIEFASLDSELWNMLQNAEIRDEFRDAIVNHFLKKRIKNEKYAIQ